jgi:hypothetical protein
MANKQTPWIDLSKYSMTLLVGVIDPPAAPLPPRILMLIGDADRHGEALTGLGFIREPNSGRWVHLGTPSLSVIQKAFPESEIIHNADMRQFARRLTSNEPAQTITQEQVKNPHETKNNQPDAAPPSGTNATYDDKNVVKNFEPKITDSKDATEAGLAQPSTTETKDEINTVSKNNNIKISPNGANNQDNIASIVHGAKFLGLNRVGQRVMDGPRGRFIQNEDGQKPILEGGNIPPGLFLRAPDMAQLNIAADGFVEEMVRGQINRFEDLRRFSSAIYETNVEPNDRRLIKAHQSIEAAILRWISRHGGKTKAEMFQAAIKLHDMHPYLGDIKRHIPDADLPIPAPISLVVQRSIGKDSDLENKNKYYS